MSCSGQLTLLLNYLDKLVDLIILSSPSSYLYIYRIVKEKKVVKNINCQFLCLPPICTNSL